MNHSLLSIDLGFDPRASDILVRLPLSMQGVCEVRHHPLGTCLSTVTSRGTLVDVAESLARAGYSVVVLSTANGRDVQCTPRDLAPAGDEPGYGWRGPAWAVQARHDNYWCVAPTLHAALSRAGWTETDLRPLES